MSSILDNLAQNNANDWLSEKLNDNPEEDQALQTTARVMTAHIWPFLAAAISDDDYRARRGVKEDEVRYMCATVAPHVASALTSYVLAGFDADYGLLHKTAQEEGLLADELLPALLGSAEDKGDSDDDQEGPFSGFNNPKAEHLVHQAPGGGVHGPYKLEKEDGGYDVVNALGESKGHHDTKGEAREQQKAMYANIPEAREQAEEQHEGSLRVAQGDPYSATTLLSESKQDEDEGEESEDDEAHEPIRSQVQHHRNTPGVFSNPKADWEIETGDTGAYSVNTTWGQNQINQQQRAAAYQQWQMDRTELERHLKRHHRTPVDGNSYGVLRNAHATDHKKWDAQGYGGLSHTHVSLAKENQFEGHMKPKEEPGQAQQPGPAQRTNYDDLAGFMGWSGQEAPRTRSRRPRPQQKSGPPLGWMAQNQRRGASVEYQVDPQGKDRMSDIITVDRYGHISAYDRSRDPQLEENDDPDPDHEISEAESRSPEHDVHYHHDEPEYEADWERPSEEGWEGHYRGGVRERGPHTSAEKEKGTVPCPICHKKFEPGELAEHMKTVHHVSESGGEDKEREKKAPGSARAGQSKAKPSAGRQTHRPTRGRPKGPAKQGQLVRSPQRPLQAPGSAAEPESGYDPSEAFPGYYGADQRPQRSRTAQAPLTGQSDVPQDPESSTGASGMYDPSSALQVASPSGVVDTDFSQQDEPQDIQAQLGQMPALSHKIGAKLAEMATEVLTYNPSLSAVAAMEVALQAVRLYPKVAAGGADYLAEPGTEGVPTEVLTDCPQCQRQAYNRQINRCHFCGFYDAGLEPSIEVT